MKNLTADIYPADVAEKATGSTLTHQRNWAARGLLHMPLDARAGKSRLYPLLGLYECAIYVHAATAGIPLPLVSATFRQRVIDCGSRIIAERAKSRGQEIWSAWKVDFWNAAGESGDIPEFTGSEQFYWVISAQGQPEALNVRAALAQPDDLSEKIASTQGNPVSYVLDVSAIVRRVDEALATEGHPVEDDE